MTRVVPFVQLETALHEGRLLIIRRSWVRAPPAPPSLSCGDVLLSGPCDWPAGPLSGPDGRRMTTPAYQRKRAGMISGLLQTSEYAREFLHLACGPLSYA